MLSYSFDEKCGTPLYAQLYQRIKEDIVGGRLKSGEKLPSKRALSRHLQISVITIQNAYAQLALEGYVQSRERSGYYVAQLEEQLALPEKPRPAPEAPKSAPQNLLDLKTNRISAGNFPFSTWSRLMRQTLAEESFRLLDPMPHNGAAELRIAISEHLYRFRGMLVSPENIVIAAGTELLYSLIIQLLGSERIYALENPGHSKVSAVCRSLNAKCAFIPLDERGMRPDALRKSGASIAHLSPAHHYPTGIVMPITRRLELLRWAQEQSAFIIEDDYDSEFRFSGRPIETLYSIDKSGCVVYMNTFSKTIAPSIRISYMVLPDSLLRAYNERLAFYSCTVPSFEQYTLAKFMSGGHFEQHISRMKNHYRQLRRELIALIDTLPFRDRLTILEEHSGLHFLLKVDTKLSDAELVSKARDMGVSISALSEFSRSDTQDFEHRLVVNYSGITKEQLRNWV